MCFKIVIKFVLRMTTHECLHILHSCFKDERNKEIIPFLAVHLTLPWASKMTQTYTVNMTEKAQGIKEKRGRQFGHWGRERQGFLLVGVGKSSVFRMYLRMPL